MDLFGKSPRPRFNDEIRSLLAKEIGKEIFEWCNEDVSLNECISDCEEIFKYNINDNGYELAKKFEDKGYSPDTELVDLLDQIWSSKDDLIRTAVEKWVIEDKIEPPYGMGTNVIVQYGHKKVEGTITEIKHKTAEYHVAIPSEGMTIDGDRRAVIKYEYAELKN